MTFCHDEHIVEVPNEASVLISRGCLSFQFLKVVKIVKGKYLPCQFLCPNLGKNACGKLFQWYTHQKLSNDQSSGCERTPTWDGRIDVRMAGCKLFIYPLYFR